MTPIVSERPASRGPGLVLAVGLFALLLGSFGAGWLGSVALERSALPLRLPALRLPGGSTLQPRQTAAAQADAGDMTLFWEAMALLDQNFYAQDELPRGNELTYAALEGVIESTGDPHSSFLTPEQAAQFQSSLEGEFEGIGARVDENEQGQFIIVAPFPGTPAAEAGLLPGDIVMEIDGESIEGLTLEESVTRVRGPAGSSVELKIQREGEAELLIFNIIRANVVIPIVQTRLIQEEGLPPIGYLQLTDFGGNATDQVKRGLQDLKAQGAEAMIVDLRYNPGGLLNASVEVTSQFIDEGLILSERFTDGREVEHPAEGGGLALDLPLVVLINEGSASASEIFAGAVKDDARGTLIGTTTFGKGSVQRLHTLSDGSLLRITVARWFTPQGNAIHEVGIEPDIVVEAMPEQVGGEDDPQLEAALQYFRENQP